MSEYLFRRHYGPLRKTCTADNCKHKMVIIGKYKPGHYFMKCLRCEGGRIWRFWK